MVPADPAEASLPSPELDPDSEQWIQMLSGPGPQRGEGLMRLHELLLRVARGEMRRRGGRLQITGPELDDLAYQAAADALLAIVGCKAVPVNARVAIRMDTAKPMPAIVPTPATASQPTGGRSRPRLRRVSSQDPPVMPQRAG